MLQPQTDINVISGSDLLKAISDHRTMRCTVLRTTPASLSSFARARAQSVFKPVAKPNVQRYLTKMSAAAEGLDKNTNDSKWKELLTAEEVCLHSNPVSWMLSVRFNCV